MPKLRVYQLARELNRDNSEIIRELQHMGVPVTSHSNTVEDRLADRLRRELGVVLSVVHFNHKMRGADADADEQFVTELSRRHELEMHCESGDVAAYAAAQHLSLEAAAREMRYEYFARFLLEGDLTRIATAHTLDDQAETVLLRIVRGAGTRGLAGIYPQLSVPGSQFSEGRQSPVFGRQKTSSPLSAFSYQRSPAAQSSGRRAWTRHDPAPAPR